MMIVESFERGTKKCVETHSLICGFMLLAISSPALSGIFQSDFPVSAQTVNPSIHIRLTESKVITQDGFPIGPQSISPLGKITNIRVASEYNQEVIMWKKMLSSTSPTELPVSAVKRQTTKGGVELSGVTVRPSYKYQQNADAEIWSTIITKEQEEVIQVAQNNSQEEQPTPANTSGERQHQADYEDNENLVSGRHFTPSVSLHAGWDDNLFRKANNITSSWFTILSPAVKYETNIGAHNLSASYAANIGNYYSSKEDDYLDQSIKLDAFLDLAIRHRLALGAEYKDWHDPRGTDDATSVVEEPDEWHSTTVDGTYSFGAQGSQGRIDLSVGHTLRRYDNNNQSTRDRDITNYSVVLNSRWAKINFLAGIELSNIDYISENPATVLASGSLDSQESSVFAGATWVATGKTSGTVKIGSLSKDFDSSKREDLSSSGWEVGIKWHPVTHSTWEFSTYQDAREQTTGNDDYVKVTDYKISWEHEWLSQYKSNIAIGIGEEVFNRTNRVDERFMFSAALYKQFNRIFKGGLNYQYSERDSTDNTSDYERNLIMFTLESEF